MKNKLNDKMRRFGNKNLNENISFPVNIEDIENGESGTLRKNDDGSITIQFRKNHIVFKNNEYVPGAELRKGTTTKIN
mgnify:FL=1